MNSKTILAGTLLTLMSLPILAQQAETPRKATVEARGDSVVIRKGEGDLRIRIYEEQTEEGEEKPEEVEIYEGIFLEEVDARSNAFLDALPFIPKKKKENAYEPHNSGLFVGFARMTDHFMGFGSSIGFPQDLSCSWDFGFNFLSAYQKLNKNTNWVLNIGARW